jgi:hypothetical protein
VITTLAATAALSIESGRYRLLSVSQTTKIILVSKIPDKTKYVLDASTAKITLNDKPAELADLQSFTVALVKFELKKGSKNGIEIDGVATEIKITNPDKESSKPPSETPVSRQ